MAKKKKNIAKRLIHHYRWMIVDDDTHESKISIRINMLNFLLTLAFFIMLMIGSAYLVLRYSPLKHYFVEQELSGDELKYKKQLLELNENMIALEDSLAKNELYVEHLRKVVTGDIKAAEVDSLMAKQTPTIEDEALLKPSEKDSLFRVQMAQEELEDLKRTKKVEEIELLFKPVRGIVTSHFDITQNHLATDIAAQEGENIKSIADGVVIFTEWNPDTGNAIIVRHDNEMVAIYKHCSKVFKEIGEQVDKGDVIAEVGNTGELSTGPHLHFELWIKGQAVDAEDYIDF